MEGEQARVNLSAVEIERFKWEKRPKGKGEGKRGRNAIVAGMGGGNKLRFFYFAPNVRLLWLLGRFSHSRSLLTPE